MGYFTKLAGTAIAAMIVGGSMGAMVAGTTPVSTAAADTALTRYEPCAALTAAMIAEGVTKDSAAWDHRTNLIGCSQDADGTERFVPSKHSRGCDALAYAVAIGWLVADGRAITDIRPMHVGIGVDRLDHARDCAMFEDQSWG